MSEFVDANGGVTPGNNWNGGAQMPQTKSHRMMLWAIIIVVVLIVAAAFFMLFRTLTVSYGIWPDTTKPKVTASSDTKGVELGLKFQTAVSGKVTGVSFYKGAGNGGTHTGTLWDKYGVKLASITFSKESATGWQTAYFKQPVSVAGNVTYVISYFAPEGHNAVNVNYFNKAFVNKRITALNDGWDGSNGLFSFSGSSTFPMSSSQASNYWVEPIFSSKVFGASVAPSAPVSFLATPSTKAVVLSWLPSVSSRPIKQYDIYRDGQLIKTVSGTPPSAMTTNHVPTNPLAELRAVTHPTVAMTLSDKYGSDTIALASTTTVNNSASNTATAPNDSSSTKTTTTVNDSGTTTTPTTTTTDPTVGSDQYTYTDTNVSPGTTYNYQVKAVDTADQSSDVSKTKATVGGNGVQPSSTPSTTSQNGGTTVVDNSAKNTATNPNDSSSTKTTTTVNNSGTTTTPSTTTSPTTTPTSGGTTASGTPATGGTTTGTTSNLGNTVTGNNQSSSSSAIWQYTNDTTDWSQYFNDASNFNINGSGGVGGTSTGGSGSPSITNTNTGQNTSTYTNTTGNTTTVNNTSSSTAH
ncbi:MAG: DUF4082 domain-containing protein [Candidatus Saccharibacteria bacterium]